MNWKFTLALLVVAAALVAYFELYEDKQPGTRDLQATADRVFVLDRNQVDGLIITSHDVKVDLRREGNHWVMKSPIADRADQPAVDQVLNGLESMRKEETFPAKELDARKLQDYGLQSPKAQLEVISRGAAKPASLYFGNDAAVEGKTYLQLGAKDGNVLVVGDELKKDLEKDVNAWRDHRLTDIAATDVNKLTIKNATGEIELQRQGDHWQIDKPLAARANDQKVNDLIAQITNLTIDGFVADDKANAASYGLAEPRGVVTIYTAANPRGSELLIGGTPSVSKPAGAAAPTPAPESVYLRLPARQSIYTVPKSVEDFLTVKPNDLRDRSLVRLNPDMVDRIKISSASGAPFILARKEKDWTLLGPSAAPAPVDAAQADRLMRQLSAATVTAFAADSAGDLAKYGLDHPALQVTFSSFASQNTAETNAGEKPIATVSFGKTEGADVYARVEEEPFVVSTPKTVLDAIPADPLQWQPLNIFQIDPEKLGSLDEQGKDRPEISVGKTDKGALTLQKGAGPLDENKAQSVINTLARLHAVRWVGANKAEYGLDDPALTLSFAIAADAKTRSTLRLGARDGEQMEYARVDGKDGVFLISRPDSDTLQQPLTPVPEPTPTPTPAATPSPAPSPTVAPAASPSPSPVESVTPSPSPVSP
jgi:hypothetical protein